MHFHTDIMDTYAINNMFYRLIVSLLSICTFLFIYMLCFIMDMFLFIHAMFYHGHVFIYIYAMFYLDMFLFIYAMFYSVSP